VYVCKPRHVIIINPIINSSNVLHFLLVPGAQSCIRELQDGPRYYSKTHLVTFFGMDRPKNSPSYKLFLIGAPWPEIFDWSSETGNFWLEHRDRKFLIEAVKPEIYGTKAPFSAQRLKWNNLEPKVISGKWHVKNVFWGLCPKIEIQTVRNICPRNFRKMTRK
jgi:hypothetical protein